MAPLKSIGRIKPISSVPPRQPVRPPVAAKASGRPPLATQPFTLRPRGPRVLGLGVKRGRPGGPGEKPPAFEGSQPEWVWYWAGKRVLNPLEDPFQPPYDGARDGSWLFTDPIGATQAVRVVGGTTPDFTYLLATGTVIVRIEGFYWHTAAPPNQQARDAYITTQAQSGLVRVERVEDAEFMHDSSGQAACRLLAEILSGDSVIGAISGGVAASPRYAVFAK